MFYYSFKATTCLIQHIVILGNSITFYYNKKEEHDSPEFEFFKTKFNLKLIYAHDDTHTVLHNPYSSISDKLPHAHYTFIGDPMKMLQKIVSYLNIYQKNYVAREASLENYKNLVKNNLDGTTIFPSFIQEIVQHFDYKTDFIPTSEASSLIESFKNYLNPKNPMHLLAKIRDLILAIFADKEKDARIRGDLFKLDDCGSILDADFNSLSAKDKHLRTYYEKLVECSDLLFKYDVYKNEDDLTQAKILYSETNVMRLIEKLNAYIERIESYISRDKTAFSSGFWFFAASRAINREANYLLAKELKQQLMSGMLITEVFSDVASRRNNIIDKYHLNNKPDFVDRGINSNELNDIINQAKNFTGENNFDSATLLRRQVV